MMFFDRNQLSNILHVNSTRFLWLLVFVILWAFATYAHLYFGEDEALFALRGFSALDFTNSVLSPENFVNDYPGGRSPLERQ